MREQLRETLERESAVRYGNGSAAPGLALQLLQTALAGELNSRRRYTRHAVAASRNPDHEVAAEFLQYAADKQRVVLRLTQRIAELALQPQRRIGSFAPGELPDLIRVDIVAECVLIDRYSDMIRELGASDRATSSTFEELSMLGEAQCIRLVRLLRQREQSEPARLPSPG